MEQKQNSKLTPKLFRLVTPAGLAIHLTSEARSMVSHRGSTIIKRCCIFRIPQAAVPSAHLPSIPRHFFVADRKSLFHRRPIPRDLSTVSSQSCSSLLAANAATAGMRYETSPLRLRRGSVKERFSVLEKSEKERRSVHSLTAAKRDSTCLRFGQGRWSSIRSSESPRDCETLHCRFGEGAAHMSLGPPR
jgi:hypothetical protein